MLLMTAMLLMTHAKMSHDTPESIATSLFQTLVRTLQVADATPHILASQVEDMKQDRSAETMELLWHQASQKCSCPSRPIVWWA
jgi:hypothetical protein